MFALWGDFLPNISQPHLLTHGYQLWVMWSLSACMNVYPAPQWLIRGTFPENIAGGHFTVVRWLVSESLLLPRNPFVFGRRKVTQAGTGTVRHREDIYSAQPPPSTRLLISRLTLTLFFPTSLLVEAPSILCKSGKLKRHYAVHRIDSLKLKHMLHYFPYWVVQRKALRLKAITGFLHIKGNWNYMVS